MAEGARKDTGYFRREKTLKLLMEKRKEAEKNLSAVQANFIEEVTPTDNLMGHSKGLAAFNPVAIVSSVNGYRANTLREQLDALDEAIEKVNKGTYGICEECGEEIPADRLEAVPFARNCIACQERIEKRLVPPEEEVFSYQEEASL